jgi:hypothetical protein
MSRAGGRGVRGHEDERPQDQI